MISTKTQPLINKPITYQQKIKTPIPEEVMRFGKRVKKLRLERKMSQMNVGASLNIDRENIRKYEKELQEPSLSTVIKFAKVFKISFNELLS